MTNIPSQIILLDSLSEGIPVIPLEAAGFYKQNCMVCLHRQGHSSGTSMNVHYNETNQSYVVKWNGEITDQILSAYRDESKNVDFAACTIALILIRELTEYTTIEQSALGTTIDYYLVSERPNDKLLFNHAARLEVSGINHENPDNTVDDRIKSKKRRLKKEGDLLDIIAVVEFGKPWSKMVTV